MLHSFTGGADGAYPLGALIKDKSGAIYGTASEGGNFDFGTVYKLTPPGVSSTRIGASQPLPLERLNPWLRLRPDRPPSAGSDASPTVATGP